MTYFNKDKNIADKATHLKDSLIEKGQNLKDDAQDKVECMVHGMKNCSCEARDALESYVKTNPMKSLGFAMLGGVLLGMLFGR